MNNQPIYAAVRYDERYARRTPIIGRKYRHLELIGISLLCGGESFDAYNLNYRGKDLSVPDTNDPRWMLYSDILDSVRNFIRDVKSLKIVTDSDPDEAALINQIVQESATKVPIYYCTIEQRIVDASAWLPDSVYGAHSDFMAYFPPHEDGRPYAEDERLDMFMSHHEYVPISRSFVNPYLDSYVAVCKAKDEAISSIVKREISYLENIKETDIANRVQEELNRIATTPRATGTT